MSRRLRIYPDSDRVEQALLADCARSDFVDASDVCSFAQLVERCEPTRWLKRAPASPTTIRFLVGALAPKSCAKAFGHDTVDTPAFAAAASDLLSHLRQQGATHEHLQAAGQTAGGRLREKTDALAALWRGLDAELDRLGLVAASERVAIAARRLREEGLPPQLKPYTAFDVLGLTDLNPARLDLLDALAQGCQREQRSLRIVVPASHGTHTDVFVAHALRQLEARWQTLDAVELEWALPDGPLAFIGARLFDDELQEAKGKAPAPALSAFSASTPLLEAREIARRVRQLTAQGVPPESIAVAYRDLGEDTEVLLEAFARYGVPARARLGVPLTASTVGRLAFEVLQLVEDDFPRDPVAALLQSRYARSLGDQKPEPARWFAEAGVRNDAVGAVGGRGAWQVRLGALAASKRAQQKEHEAERVEDLAKSVQHLITLCRAIPAEATAQQLLAAWWKAVDGLGLFEAIRAREPAGVEGLLRDELDRALARDQSAAEALGALRAQVEQALVDSGLGKQRMERRRFLKWLVQVASDLNLAPRGVRTGAVWLLDVRELPTRHFEHVFVGGLLDGRFPGRPRPLPLLSEDERARLNEASRAPLFRLGVSDGGVTLPLRLAEDRLLLHLALCAGDTAVTLSHARIDDAGRELLRSPFLDALGRCVAGFHVEALARRPVPDVGGVASEEELRERAALEVLSPAATRLTVPSPARGALEQALGTEPWFTAARALAEVEAERLRFFTDEARAAGPWSGSVAGTAVAEQLQPKLAFGADAPASAAALGSWGNCAFQGFSKYVLRLVPPEERGEELDARGRGSFWHEALKRLVPALQQAGLWTRLDVTDEELEPHLDAAVAAAAQVMEEKGPIGHPDLWELGQTRAKRVLRRLVKSEAMRPFDGPPQGFEVRFGVESAEPALRTVMLPAALEGEADVYLQGTIDRFDVGASTVGVVDYKATGAGQPKQRGEAQLISDFQMPVYLFALSRRFADRRLDAAWVGIKKREVRRLSSLPAGKDVDTLLAVEVLARREAETSPPANLANAVHGLLGRLRGGDFGPRPQSCDFCDFKAVCRISRRQFQDGEGGDA